jgi:tetratricopeptide (TPR) repeat protein
VRGRAAGALLAVGVALAGVVGVLPGRDLPAALTPTAAVAADRADAVDPLDAAGAPAAVRRAVFRAERAVEVGEMDRAADVLASALADGHDHPALRYRLGTYRLATGQADAALPHLRTAADALPDRPATGNAEALLRDLARAEYEAGHHARAARAFTAAHATAVRRQAATPDGDHDDDPAPPDALLYYAAIAWSLAEEPARALDQLAPLVAATADTVPQEWVRALVSIAAQAEQPARADAGVARLLRDHPDRPAAWRLASEQAQLTGDLPRAAARLQVAHWLEPLAGPDRRRLAELQAAAGAPRQAARVYAEISADHPDDLALAHTLAAAWLQAHEPDSARVVLREALAGVREADEPAGEPAGGSAARPGAAPTGADQDRPRTTAADLLALLADLEYGERRWDAASAALRRLTTRDPDRGRAWLLLGAVELQRDRPGAARTALQRATEHPEVADRARRLLAQVPATR